MSNNFSYKVGGSLPENAPSYVVRQADLDLYNELKAGNFCYIFNSRQMGKTSLQVRTIKRLQAEGIACTTIDISGRGSKEINPEQWYAGIVYTLVANFEIANPSEFIRTWWKENSQLSPLQRLDIFIETILLDKIKDKIVIFIDEIDSILSLSFQGDDFFSWIRSCYEKRNYNSNFNRITFVLLGVATPSDLIADKVRTPFNIGCAIQLNGFQRLEILPLAEGLKGIKNSQAVLPEILAWTGGQPFLTQKLCDLLVNSQQYNEEITEVEFVKNVVTKKIIESWESQDEPPHLKTIKDRILMSKHNTGGLLGLYQKILQRGQIPVRNSPEQIELRLSGLVVEQSGCLKVYNRIYATVFDLNWVEKALMNLRPYSEALLAWFASNCEDNSRLLQGLSLQEAQIWAVNKSLTEQDYQFLAASQELEKQEIAKALSLQAEESRILAQANDTLTTAQHQAKRKIRIGSGVLITSLLGAIIASIAASTSTNQLREAQAGTQLEKIGANALQEFESRQIESLVTAIDGGQKLQEIVKDGRSLDKYPTVNPMFALRTIVDNIREVNQFTAHQEYITSTNWSYDGKYLVTASSDRTAKIWNTSGQLLKELKSNQVNPIKGNKGQLFGANFSRDGKHILAMSDDNTARIWDRYGKEVAILKHQEWVTSASFSPDGKTVITTSEKAPEETAFTNEYGGKIARIWDLSGNLLIELKHEARVNQASFSPDGKYILTASDDKTARIWDVSGKLLKTLPVNNGGVRSAYWSLDSQYILTNSDNSDLWNISGKKIKTFKLENEKFVASEAGFSPDGKRVFISTHTTTRIFDISGKQIAEIGGKQLVDNAGFSPNGKLFFTQDSESLRIWDISDNIFSTNFVTELVGYQGKPRWSPDGRYIVTFGLDRKVRIWDLSLKVPPVRINSSEAIQQASVSPDGKYIVTPTSKSAIIWDKNGKQLTRITGHSDSVYSANFSPDGKRIITASYDNTARVWDTSGKQLLLLAGHKNGVELASFSPDGKYILTTTYEPSQTSRIWSQSGKLLATFKARGMTWSPNSKYIMAKFDYNGKNNSSLWDISGKKIVQLNNSENSYLGASFSKDGERIVTTDRNKIIIWNTSGQKLSEFKVDRDIANASFSPDGKSIIATSTDNRAIIWDINGKQLVEIPHPDMLGYAKFSPDGKLIITASSTNTNMSHSTFRIWDISGKQLGQYKYLSTFLQEVNFSPDGKYVYAYVQGNRPSLNSILIWQIDDLDGLLTRGCDRLKDYLNIHSQVGERLKVCQGK
jgi:WD40 repeat protein